MRRPAPPGTVGRYRLFPLIRLVALCVAVGTVSLPAATEGWAILPLAQIHAGMRGYGKTVFSGTEIGTFDVRIIDVLRSDGVNPDMLLIKVGGSAIEECGGIASGMSGSPIYINGQLAAAVAYTTSFSDTLYGYATPIEFMLPLLDRVGEGQQRALSSTSFHPGHEPAQHPFSLAARGSMPGARTVERVLQSLRGPLMVSGLSLRSAARLADRLGGAEVRVVQAGSAAPMGGAQVEPGASVAIQLVRGDISVSALGTVTCVDGERFLAFGHAFLHQGEVEYPLALAYVHQIIRSNELPFKVASPSPTIAGVVRQDREVGLAGTLGAQISPIGVGVRVSAEGAQDGRTIHAQLIRDPELTREMAATAVLGTADSVLDRIGPGSARVALEVRLRDGTDCRRIDWVSSDADVGGQCAAEVGEMLRALAGLGIGSDRIESISVGLDVAGQLAEYRIARVRVGPTIQSGEAQGMARRGEDLRVSVLLLGPDGRPLEKTIELPIPGATESGIYRVRVHGKNSTQMMQWDPWEPPDVWAQEADAIRAFSETGRRQTLVCDLIATPLSQVSGSWGIGAERFWEGNTGEIREVPPREAPTQDPVLKALMEGTEILQRVTADLEGVVAGEGGTWVWVSPKPPEEEVK